MGRAGDGSSHPLTTGQLAVSAYPALMAGPPSPPATTSFRTQWDAVAVLAVARVAVVGTERWQGLAVHSSEAIARRAQVALLGVIIVVWLPRGQWVTLGGDLLVLVALEALRQREQSLPAGAPTQTQPARNLPPPSSGRHSRTRLHTGRTQHEHPRPWPDTPWATQRAGG